MRDKLVFIVIWNLKSVWWYGSFFRRKGFFDLGIFILVNESVVYVGFLRKGLWLNVDLSI